MYKESSLSNFNNMYSTNEETSKQSQGKQRMKFSKFHNNFFKPNRVIFNKKQKSLSQLCNSRDIKEIGRFGHDKFIETMYRSGGFFKYDLNKPHIGSKRSHLGDIENCTRTLVPEFGFEKNRLMMFNTQIINLRNDMKTEYKKLNRNLNHEVSGVEMKLGQLNNLYKTENAEVNKEMKELRRELNDSKVLLNELKERINKLKLRTDGRFMYNEDGIPVLNTKIEFNTYIK